MEIKILPFAVQEAVTDLKPSVIPPPPPHQNRYVAVNGEMGEERGTG